MKVKNVLVSDVEIFKEELIRELIKYGISYVQIEDEFHFLDYIYRIYDLKKTLRMYFSYLNSISFDNFKLFDFDNYQNSVLHIKNRETIYNSEKNYIKINKKMIRQQNRRVNGKLKK